ncbi:MAG: twin-arginine translocase subunit TatC [Flavobacteriales bacterium]|nr:MAG: twin-arginine translocase subunit TatC [Flavobacteriales bacterium]
MTENTENTTLEENEMSFLEHLEALRWHLIRSVVAVVVVAIAAFVNKSIIFDAVIFAPKNADFPTYQWLCQLSEKLHQWLPDLITKNALCIGQNFPQLQNISMAGQFMTHVLVSVVAGLVITFPYVFWELWRFIKPGMKSTEKKYSRGVVFFSSSLFLMGILFGYFIIAPLAINFFLTYQISDAVVNLPTLRTYIATITTIVMACGIVFELPVVVYFLTKVGLLTPEFMRKYRKHALVAALILSAVITPPDVFSQLLVSVPLFFLYEISIYVSKMVIRKEEKR